MFVVREYVAYRDNNYNIMSETIDISRFYDYKEARETFFKHRDILDDIYSDVDCECYIELRDDCDDGNFQLMCTYIA